MRSKLLYEEKALKTFVLVFDKDEQVKESLLAFAAQNRLSAAQLSAIGAFSEVTLGYFQRPSKTYKDRSVNRSRCSPCQEISLSKMARPGCMRTL